MRKLNNFRDLKELSTTKKPVDNSPKKEKKEIDISDILKKRPIRKNYATMESTKSTNMVVLGDDYVWDVDGIEHFLKSIGCHDYIIQSTNNGLSVDIIGDIKIIGIKRKLPFKINKVGGSFVWEDSLLESVANMPSFCGGSFTCTNMVVDCIGNTFTTCSNVFNVSGSKNLRSINLDLTATDTIDVSSCDLRTLDFIKSGWIIRVLNASGNKLKSIPSIMSNADDLQIHHLDVSKNFIVSKAKENGITNIDYSNNPCDPQDGFENARW